MRSKIVCGLLGLVFATAACGIDTGDPAGEGAGVAETPAATATGPGPDEGGPETAARPSEQPVSPSGQPSEQPAGPTSQAAAPQAEAAQPSEDPEESASEPPGSRANPLPAGTVFVLSGRVDGEDELVALWEITLGTTDPDATDEVLAENPLNEIADGRKAVMTEVIATYIGPESGNAWVDLNYTYLGSDDNTFAYGSDDSCGTIPNDLFNYGEQFPGATVTGNVCQAVPDDVIDGGMWIVAFAFTWDDRRVFVKAE